MSEAAGLHDHLRRLVDQMAWADERVAESLARSRPLDELVEHVALHGHYHRGQIAARLRRLGLEPPITDMIVFLREVARDAARRD